MFYICPMVSTICSESWKKDGRSPTMSNMTLFSTSIVITLLLYNESTHPQIIIQNPLTLFFSILTMSYYLLPSKLAWRMSQTVMPCFSFLYSEIYEARIPFCILHLGQKWDVIFSLLAILNLSKSHAQLLFYLNKKYGHTSKTVRDLKLVSYFHEYPEV